MRGSQLQLLTAPHIPLASEMMNSSVNCLGCDEPIETAIRTLLRQGFSGAPVVDADGKLCGVVSERDCLRVLELTEQVAVPLSAIETVENQLVHNR